MSGDAKFDEAAKLIDAFAHKLLALNEGKKIPTAWKTRLLSAIAKTKQQKRGVKADYQQISRIVELLTLSNELVRKPRDKHHNPAKYKDEIAREVGVSRKTVERIDLMRPDAISEMGMLDSMDKDKRKAYLEGIGEAIWKEISSEDDQEQEALRQLRKRKA